MAKLEIRIRRVDGEIEVELVKKFDHREESLDVATFTGDPSQHVQDLLVATKMLTSIVDL